MGFFCFLSAAWVGDGYFALRLLTFCVVWGIMKEKRTGRAFGERDYGNFTAGKGQNAVQYLFGRTVLLRLDFGIGGEKPLESRAGCDGKRACGNSIRERKEYGVR